MPSKPPTENYGLRPSKAGLVPDANQKQTAGRRDITRLGKTPPRMTEPFLDLFKRRVPRRRLHDPADDQSRHLIKEAVGFEFQGEQSTGTADHNTPDSARCVSNGGAPICGERGEVV